MIFAASVKVSEESATPDVQVTSAPGSFKGGQIGELEETAGSGAGVRQMRPLSRGYVEAKSNRPGEAPVINPRYLSEATDRRAIIGGLRLPRRVFDAPALKQFVREDTLPGARVQSARRRDQMSEHPLGNMLRRTTLVAERLTLGRSTEPVRLAPSALFAIDREFGLTRGHTLEKAMIRHTRPTNHRRLPTRIGGGVLTAAAILGTTALVVARRARQAERNNPPAGRFLDIEGVRVHYLERGEGPPLVLLHGNGSMVQDFEISGIVERLARQYRVIALDRPGFGHTNRPKSQNWTPAAQAELVHKVLVHLEINQAIVVGHSWGTLVALSLALDHPADVRSLVLLSGYYFPSFRADVLASSAIAAPIIGDLLSCTVAPVLGRAMRSRVFRKLFAPAAVPPRFQAEFPTELSLRPSQLKATAVDTVSMTPSAAALAPRYGELKMPVLIMAGTGDRLVDFGSQSERLDDVLPSSFLVPIEGAGHMIHHSAPEKVVDGINLAVSRSGAVEYRQLLPMKQPITGDAGQKAEAVIAV